VRKRARGGVAEQGPIKKKQQQQKRARVGGVAEQGPIKKKQQQQQKVATALAIR
jgi:hypothetical protein